MSCGFVRTTIALTIVGVTLCYRQPWREVGTLLGTQPGTERCGRAEFRQPSVTSVTVDVMCECAKFQLNAVIPPGEQSKRRSRFIIEVAASGHSA